MINDDKWLDEYGNDLVTMCKYIDLYVNNIDKNQKSDINPFSEIGCALLYTVYYKFDYNRDLMVIFYWLDDGTISIRIDDSGIVLSTNDENSLYGNKMLKEYFSSFKNLIISTLILIMGGEININE